MTNAAFALRLKQLQAAVRNAAPGTKTWRRQELKRAVTAQLKAELRRG